MTCTPLFAFVPRRHYISLSEKSSLVFSSALRSDRFERHLINWAQSVGSSYGERTLELEVFHILDNVWKGLSLDFHTLNEGLLLWRRLETLILCCLSLSLLLLLLFVGASKLPVSELLWRRSKADLSSFARLGNVLGRLLQ